MSKTVTPDASRVAAQISGAGGVLTDDDVRAFVHEQLDAVSLDGASVCLLVARRHPQLPAAASALRGPPGTVRPGSPAHGAGGTEDARGDE